MGLLKIMLRTGFASLLLLFKVYGNGLPIDEKVSTETVCLYKNLSELSKSGQFLFGHQDALAYDVGWRSIPGKSDIKEVTGDHPGLCGWDLVGIETETIVNITGVSFEEIRQYTLQGHECGEIITYGGHMMNPVTGKPAGSQAFATAQFLPADSSVKIFETNITMDDGVTLSTRIFLPDTNKSFAAVLIRTPYNKELEMWMDKRFLSNNIAIIIQDVRGKYKSKGEFYPFVNERADGLATLRWIRDQPWSNGVVGGWGVSYMGYTQWIIADSLDAAAPLLTSSGMYDFVYPDRLLSLQSAFLWGYANAAKAGDDLSPGNVKKE